MSVSPSLSMANDTNHGDAPSLHDLTMLDWFEVNPQPTFILHKTNADISRDLGFLPVYWNPAICKVDSGTLWKAIKSTVDAEDLCQENDDLLHKFQGWSISNEFSGEPYLYRGISWTKTVVANQYIVVSGSFVNSPAVNSVLEPEGEIASPKRNSFGKSPTFDWTDVVPPLSLSAHVAWARSVAWSETPLGAMSSWPSQLRSIANLVMHDPRPAVVFYGPELIMIYNEAEVELLGNFHPCMGVSARVALESVWSEYFEPIIERNLVGETVEKINTSIHMVRNGFLEETYFSLKFIPIFDAGGATVGHYEPLVETTREVISQRRSRTLLGLSEDLPRARNSTSYWSIATDVLSRNDKDIPFALLYSAEVDEDSASSGTRNSGNDQQCKLRGSFGLSSNSQAGPVQLDFRKDHGFSPYFRQAMAARKTIIIDFDQDARAAELVKDINWQGFGDPCRRAAISPLNPTASVDTILGFMVVGLNPRRPLDDDYFQFIQVASRLLSTSLTSILAHEEDISRRERTIALAEAMKHDLKTQLLESQKEAERNTFKFQRFAERADVGIFILDMTGVYSYRNKAWFDILGPVDRNIALAEAWNALIDDEYAPLGQAKFEALNETKEHQSFELRLKTTWKVSSSSFDDSITDEQPKWVLCSVFPELDEGGAVVEIVGCITDISQQKWGERLQATHASRAQDSKRQLENFIDSTSHEMRNPLSAILPCADSIITSHNALEIPQDHQTSYQVISVATIEAADTIVQCSKHMKTIVDDVLTISKLDSGLFVMTPVHVQLESVARDAVKMFEGEAKSADVLLEFRLEESCNTFSIDQVSLDPTRVLQVLINLLTNAIKFTRLEERRHIKVSLGVSHSQPTHNHDGTVQFLPSSESCESQALKADWEKGVVLFVTFSVTDTGRGMSDSEHKLLFARFSQASPRTHIEYGGSGLGLFISRQLTEMHGGAIGFSSKAGIGSTFSFYIKAREIPTAQREDFGKGNVSIRAQAAVLRRQSDHTRFDDPSPDTKPTHSEVPNNQLHILIVEDNLVNQRVLAKQLRSIGMNVAVANHGEEALEYLRTTNYCLKNGFRNVLSLILMDWEMPVMDGLTCVRRIRQLQRDGAVSGHVPVIAVTANVRTEQVEVALEAGMDDVISKPFRIPELRDCIQKTLRHIDDG